jgi:hypothetical protein
MPVDAPSAADKARYGRVFAIAIVVAFLTGLIPMWILAHTRAVQRDATTRETTELRLATAIALSALHAKRGEYETARQHASHFYTLLRSAVDNGDGLTQSERDSIKPLIRERDEMITLLARSDPAVLDRLFAIEYQLSQVLKIQD